MDKDTILKKLKEIIADKSAEYKYLGVHKVLDISFLKFECLTCNHTFIVDINTIIQDESIYCPNEYDVYPAKGRSTQQIISKLFDEFHYFELLDLPENSNSKVNTKCTICGNVMYRKVSKGTGCSNRMCESKKNTFYKSEMRDRFMESIPSNIVIESEYLGVDKPIKAKCLDCGNEWYSPKASYIKDGCPECKKSKKGEARVQFMIKSLKEHNNPKIILSESEVFSDGTILAKCSFCKELFNTSYKRLLAGKGHLECSILNRTNVVSADMEEVVSLWGSKFEILSDIISMNKKIKSRCNSCGHIFNRSPKHMMINNMCPKCESNRVLLTNDEFIDRVSKIHKNISILNTYTSRHGIVKAKCDECGDIWETTPARLHKGHGCPRCAIVNNAKKRVLVDTELESRLRKVHGEKYRFISTRLDVDIRRSEVECTLCGNIWQVEIGNLLRERGSGCPKCNASYGSNESHQFLSEYFNVESEKMLVCNNHKMYIDSFIPELSIGFEYDGLRWHTEESLNKRNFSDGVNYHKYKQEVARDNGIRTIHIRENEWRDKNDIVKSRILSIIGKIDKKIYARKCEIREVPNNTKVEFLNKYHIQGNDNSSIRIGLYYKGKIVSIMTFGKIRNTLSGKEDKEYETYELIRFASRTYLNVVGGFSKLLKYAETLLSDMGIERIKTFADKRWSEGSIYESNGFILSHSSNPNYIYYRGDRTYSRYEFQKHKLYNLYEKGIIEEYREGMSERECAETNGFNKVYDCGNLVYYKILI